jgi:phospholipid/cholesterol/gamma-HCH transport system substrate-binding protein
MKNTLETRLGIFFALGLVATIVIIEMIGGLEFLKHGTYIHARFNNALELKQGDPVKMAGVQVGRVEDIKIAEDKVDVFMKINRRDAAIHTDSKAIIKFAGLMGQNYISIDFGSPKSPLVTTGAELTTLEQTDLSTLMARIDKVASGVEGMTKQFSGDGFGNMLGPITDFIKDNKDKLSSTISNVQTISSQIAQGKGTVGRLINDDTLYNSALSTVTNFNDTSTDIKSIVAEAKSVMNDINAGKGTLGKLTKDEALYKETTTAMTNLREIFEKINRGQGSVGKLVNDESLYKNARMTLQKLDKATEGLEDQGPLSIMGVMANGLF